MSDAADCEAMAEHFWSCAVIARVCIRLIYAVHAILMGDSSVAALISSDIAMFNKNMQVGVSSMQRQTGRTNNGTDYYGGHPKDQNRLR